MSPGLEVGAAFALEVVLVSLALGLLAPGLVVVGECLAAFLPGADRCRLARARDPGRVAVVVPAHDEAEALPAALAGLLPELGAEDRLLVVADNCTDATAEVARQAGAEVVERRDPDRRGKGHALRFGVEHLAARPPDILVFVDADCSLAAGSLDLLAGHAAATGGPVQAEYVLRAAPEAGRRTAVSALACLVKNVVRPRGLRRLGLPCQLTGAGMAFPWRVLAERDLGGSHLVEDMLLGLELAVAGHPPRSCPEVVVESELPTGDGAARTQRTRWEHGHLGTLLGLAPRLAGAGLAQRRFELLALAADLAAPPVSALVLLWLPLTAACALAARGVPGVTWLPATLSGGGLALLALALLAVWVRFGRSLLPARALAAVPAYVLWKVPVYAAYLLRRRPRDWVRTERGRGDPHREEATCKTTTR